MYLKLRKGLYPAGSLRHYSIINVAVYMML